MSKFTRWWKGERAERPQVITTPERTPLTYDDVQSAIPRNKALVEQTNALENEMLRSLIVLTKKSATLRLKLGHATLSRVSGGSNRAKTF